MKSKLNLRFESWKTALISSFIAKLIMDIYLLLSCSEATQRVYNFPESFSQSKIDYGSNAKVKATLQ